jgi:L-lysine exporter family protein LysE/ArgO
VTWSPFLAAALSGLGLGLSLIVVIGAQNAFVLRQGLRGQHVRAVVALCTVSDVLLIAAGVLGAGAVLTRLPGLLTGVRIGGGAFLLGYGILAARRAWRPTVLVADATRKNAGLAATAATCLALTWLNAGPSPPAPRSPAPPGSPAWATARVYCVRSSPVLRHGASSTPSSPS